MHKVVLSSRGQVVIPKEIRKKLGLSAGQTLRVLDVGQKIMFIPEAEDPIEKGLGLLREDEPKGSLAH